MIWIVLALLIALDQLTKYWVVLNLKPDGIIRVLPGFFNLIYTENRGAAWSFLADADWGIYVLRIVSLAAGIVMLVLLPRMKHPLLRWSLMAMAAGTIGNGIDRWLHSYVVDFLDFHFGSYVFPTFNLADSLLVVGTILFVAGLMLIPAEQQFRHAASSVHARGDEAGDE